jgi:uncharacterized protein involved in cysteine biosynthesis
LDIGCGPGQITTKVVKAHGTKLLGHSRIVALAFNPRIAEQLEHRKMAEIEKGDTLWSEVETVVCKSMLQRYRHLQTTVSHAITALCCS